MARYFELLDDKICGSYSIVEISRLCHCAEVDLPSWVTFRISHVRNSKGSRLGSPLKYTGRLMARMTYSDSTLMHPTAAEQPLVWPQQCSNATFFHTYNLVVVLNDHFMWLQPRKQNKGPRSGERNRSYNICMPATPHLACSDLMSIWCRPADVAKAWLFTCEWELSPDCCILI